MAQRVMGLWRKDGGLCEIVEECGCRTVTAGCCPGVSIPEVLTLDFTVSTGCCFPNGGTAKMIYNPVDKYWMTRIWASPCASSPATLIFYCCDTARSFVEDSINNPPNAQTCGQPGNVVTEWWMAIKCTSSGSFTTYAAKNTSTCSPFSVDFEPASPSALNCCTGGSVLKMNVHP